jgi:hypothetical protein
MAIYKRGETYWYEFQFKGERIQESAKTGNKGSGAPDRGGSPRPAG